MDMKKEEPSKTLVVIMMGFIVLYLIFKIDWLLYVAIGTGLIGVFSNYLSVKISRLWLKLSLCIGFLMSRVLLTIIFYFFLYPLAIMVKIFNMNSNFKKKKENTDSYYFNINKNFSSKDLENIW